MSTNDAPQAAGQPAAQPSPPKLSVQSHWPFRGDSIDPRSELAGREAKGEPPINSPTVRETAVRMQEHFVLTGAYSAQDLNKVLGDPRESVSCVVPKQRQAISAPAGDAGVLTDEQILAIGRRALDKCHGTDAQHLYIAREVERALSPGALLHIKPQLPGFASAAPSLHEFVYRYYRANFNEPVASEYAEQYLAAISQQGQPTHQADTGSTTK